MINDLEIYRRYFPLTGSGFVVPFTGTFAGTFTGTFSGIVCRHPRGTDFHLLATFLDPSPHR
ncbi:hypothetical protein [Streptomyces sp. NPDC001410]|uniref:hypothetical protein n=1 Tax=Streptomyces sp. NPDC001410 TaxID=3364574 RepID=UPI0036783765